MTLLSRIFPIMCALITPTLIHASGTIFYLNTGHTGSQTFLDNLPDTTTFYSYPAISAADAAAGGGTYGMSAFHVTFNWLFGGGDFLVKDGSSTVDDIVFTLYDSTDSLSSPFAGLVVAQIAQTHQQVCDQKAALGDTNCGQFGTGLVQFHFGAAFEMQSGRDYFAALSSVADHGSAQWFIKIPQDGIDVIPIQDADGNLLSAPDPSGAVPEPGTWMMFAGGLGLVALGRLRRKKP